MTFTHGIIFLVANISIFQQSPDFVVLSCKAPHCPHGLYVGVLLSEAAPLRLRTEVKGCSMARNFQENYL